MGKVGGNYGFLAFLNNADEPWIDVPKPDIAAKRKAAKSALRIGKAHHIDNVMAKVSAIAANGDACALYIAAKHLLAYSAARIKSVVDKDGAHICNPDEYADTFLHDFADLFQAPTVESLETVSSQATLPHTDLAPDIPPPDVW